MDLGEKWAKEQLAQLEARIKQIYGEAAEEVQGVIADYFEKFAERDKIQRKKLEAGEITKEYYTQWILAQIGRGERFEALRDALAERMTEANEVAVAYINDVTPSVYALNRNYAAYTIEQVTGFVAFTLWDESTVRRLIVEQPDLMPYYPPKKALKRGIDLEWGKKQITKQVTSGILLGESIGKISDRLQTNIPNMNRDSAIRSARTAVTSAQNAGRMDSYDAAEKMGIEMEKEWRATLDGRTRHSHRRLDGEIVGTDELFSNGLRYPGDPLGAPSEVYNCRCTLVPRVKGVDNSNSLRRDRYGPLPNMTYAQWEKQKRGEGYLQEWR